MKKMNIKLIIFFIIVVLIIITSNLFLQKKIDNFYNLPDYEVQQNNKLADLENRLTQLDNNLNNQLNNTMAQLTALDQSQPTIGRLNAGSMGVLG
jgi:predicted PurR-regulated permease PerM